MWCNTGPSGPGIKRKPRHWWQGKFGSDLTIILVTNIDSGAPGSDEILEVNTEQRQTKNQSIC